MNKCLSCYQELTDGERDFHPSCAEKFFGTKDAPKLDYTLQEIDLLASQIIEKQTSITGVQPKLSLHLNTKDAPQRLTIVGLWGRFIMKPQTNLYPQLAENEDLTMRLAEIAGIEVVPHTLMRMADGSLCYLCRRIDRTENGGKIAMEDFCQLTERPTEYKYKSSYEHIGKTLLRYSYNPENDIVKYIKVVLFSYLVGNNDMHLKNFSLYEIRDNEPQLTPAYDLLNAAIANPKDREELALRLNGKKANIKSDDFLQASAKLGIGEKVINELIKKYKSLEIKFVECIKSSFLSAEMQELYIDLLTKRLNKL